MASTSILEQIRRNAVALISLVVAVTSLGYNTWRNEASEENRNQRWASFELLLELGELHQVVDHLYYDRDAEDRGNPRKGWAIVDMIRGVAVVIDDPIPARANALHDAWAENWNCIARREGCDDEQALEDVERAMEALRTDVVTHLQMLD